MAATPLSAVREVHNNDETITQYISQGVWYSLAPDNLDITAGGVLVLQHKGMVREKTTESVQEITRLDLIYFHTSLETLDQYVVPWAIAAFDDQEDVVDGVISIDGAGMISCDIAEDEPIQMGVEAAKDKNGNNVFSATVPLKIWYERPKAAYAYDQ